MTQFILHRIVLLVPEVELAQLKLPEEVIKDSKDVYDGFEQLYNDCVKETDPL